MCISPWHINVATKIAFRAHLSEHRPSPTWISSSMRITVFCLSLFMVAPAAAQDTVDPVLTPAGIPVSSSISINAPLIATDAAGKIAEEDTHRKSLFSRAEGECEMLLKTIAKTCSVTGVIVSTQVNSNPGQSAYIYATATISMQVEFK
jgi:hypothetical protein